MTSGVGIQDSAKKRVSEVTLPSVSRVAWECHELCVSGPVHAVSDTQASKRSPNIMANWL
ncbi:hypothetical protein ACSSV8_003767, partial [Roseovarius sp. MBR-79]